jgi:hypothetical protein
MDKDQHSALCILYSIGSMLGLIEKTIDLRELMYYINTMDCS